MKTRIFFIAIIVLFLFGCTTKVVNETVESYPDGSAKLIRTYKDDGHRKTLLKECKYYPTHQKYMEGSYKNEKRDGLWMSWFENGNKWSEGYFKDGLDDGMRIIYRENGQKYIEGKYTAGVKTGVWKIYDEKGNLAKEETYP